MLFANLLVKPFWILGIDRAVQNQLGPDVYGLYFAVFNFSFLFSILLDFGVNNYNNREVASNGGIDLRNIFAFLKSKSLLSLAYLAVSFVVAVLSGFTQVHFYLLALLLLNQVLLNMLLFFRSNISALHAFKVDGFLSVIDKLIAIIICAALLWVPVLKPYMNMYSFILAQSVGLLFSNLIAVYFVYAYEKKHGFRNSQNHSIKEVLNNAFPYALLGILMALYYRLDAVMIERLLPENQGSTEAGIYAASFRILDALVMFPYLIAGVLMPMFAKAIKQKEDVSSLVLSSSKLLLYFSIPLAAICYFFSAPIMHLLYTNSDTYWAEIFQCLLISLVPIAIVYVHGSLLTAGAAMKQLNIIALIGLAINFAGNIFAIKYYHALGAAVTTLVTQLVVAFLHIYVSKKQFQYPLRTKALFRLSIYAILQILIIGIIQHFVQSFALCMALATLATLGLLFTFERRDIHRFFAYAKSSFSVKND